MLNQIRQRRVSKLKFHILIAYLQIDSYAAILYCNIVTRKSLGEFEHLVLLAALHLKGEGDGRQIVEAIRKRTGRSISRSSLYITFDRLETRGFLCSRLADPSQQRGGRPRRYVAVTDRGIRALSAARLRMMAMWNGFEPLLGESP